MPYSIEQADLRVHKNVILDLWQQNYVEIGEGRFSILYENNPCAEPTVFLLKHNKTDSFVGAISLFPRNFFLQGNKLRGYICGDLVVNKKHRLLGPALSLFRAAIKKCHDESPCVLISIPNKNSAPVAKRVGFVNISPYYRMTKVLNSHPYLQRQMKSSKVSNLLAYLMDWLLWLRHKKSCIAWKSKYKVKVMDNLDSHFNSLGDKIQKSYIFLGERTSSYLNWRHNYPTNEEKFFFLVYKETDLVGYISYHLCNGQCQIKDIAYDNVTTEVQKILSLFTEYHYSEDTNSIAITLAGPEQVIKGFISSGFVLRETDMTCVAYSSSSNTKLLENLQRNCWYLTMVDNDT